MLKFYENGSEGRRFIDSLSSACRDRAAGTLRTPTAIGASPCEPVAWVFGPAPPAFFVRPACDGPRRPAAHRPPRDLIHADTPWAKGRTDRRCGMGKNWNGSRHGRG